MDYKNKSSDISGSISFQKNGNRGENNLSESINQNDKKVYNFRVVLLGDVSVGKTSIFSRFLKNQFDDDCKCTLGVEKGMKDLNLDKNTIANLKIWDTSGQERFKSITKQYYQDANGVLFIFDITKKISFTNLDMWISCVWENNDEENVVGFIVGNKIDMDNKRKVSRMEGEKFAESKNMHYIEVSAKNGTNILMLFEQISGKMVAKESEKEERRRLKEESEEMMKFCVMSPNKENPKMSECC